MSESRRVTRSKRLAIDSKTGKKLDHLHTIDMSKEETVEIFEKMLQPIKEAISKLMTQEVMLMHLEGFKSTFVQQLEEQKTVINSLKEDNLQLESRVAILENSLKIIEQKSDDTEQYSRRTCLRVDRMPLQDKETEEEIVNNLVENFQDIRVHIDSRSIERAHSIGPVFKQTNEDGTVTDQQQVIVKFKSWSSRTQVYRARKRSKNLKYRVDLTKRRLSLLAKAREVTKGIPEVDFAFSDVNCRLAFRLTSGEFKFFNSETEIANVIANL